MKKICVLFPGLGLSPIGGYKIVYEYLNRLSDYGYEVHIVHAGSTQFSKQSISKKNRSIMRYLYGKVNKCFVKSPWFELRDKIKVSCVWTLSKNRVPNADIYIATSAITSVYLNKYPISNERKIYFIQHFENWFMSDDDVLETWRFKMKKIVIAPWLKNIADNINQKVFLVPNAFDFNYFKASIKPTERYRYSISMLYHTFKWKGCEDGLKAIDRVKTKYENLRVTLFGTCKRPSNLPDYIDYYKTPDKALHNKILNESSVFIGTSYAEGWGLTVGEAMICGCAVACTNNGGYRTMAIDGQTALLSEPGDWKSLSNNIITLIENDSLRFQLINNALVNIKQYNWESSFNLFLNVIN